MASLAQEQERASTRSERVLREILAKDNRSRSLSRNPSMTSRTSQRPHFVSEVRDGDGVHDDHDDSRLSPSPYLVRTKQSYSSVSSNRAPSSSSGNDNDVFLTSTANSALAALTRRPNSPSPSPAPGHTPRPNFPSPRYTHDGVIQAGSTFSRRPVSPSPARSKTAPLVVIPRTETSSQPLAHKPRQREINETNPPQWIMPDSSSPSPSSTPASQKSFEDQDASSSSSHPLPCTPPATAATFNVTMASEFCRQQEGYVSFSEVLGLGRPAGEEEEEQAERARLENEAKRKKGWWGWLDEASGLMTRSKSPAPPAARTPAQDS